MGARVIFDTSYLLKFPAEFDLLLNDAAKQQKLDIVFVIPYVVLQELDKLKVILE